MENLKRLKRNLEKTPGVFSVQAHDRPFGFDIRGSLAKPIDFSGDSLAKLLNGRRRRAGLKPIPFSLIVLETESSHRFGTKQVVHTFLATTTGTPKKN